MMRITTQTMYQMNGEVRTPRPNPQIFYQPQTFSTKKERGTPKDALPPKPPVKSAPPLSRVFHQKRLQRAQAVSFRSSETSIQSPHYDEASRQLYFDQCFEIEGKVGAGSFGEVFKVRSREDKQLYAVKRSRERFRGEADRKRKLEEVAKHEKLPKHPNCVRFVKAWEEKCHLYIQTELCQASLSDLAENNHNIPERLVWNYLVDLLMAVQHLHDNDLVHMDIKPDNIFLGFDGICKLGDFGLMLDTSKCFDYSEAMEGDPKYLAPELMLGKFGKPADVFSLGITILELASDLDLPRGGDTWHELRSGRLPEEFLQGISDELKEVIREMMIPDPLIRPTAEQMLSKPEISKVWRRRKRDLVLQKAMDYMNSMYQYLLSCLLMLWLMVTFPLHSVMPEPLVNIATPTKAQVMKRPPEWDHSFSDDDVLDNDISIHNNSMGVPLDTSTSSEDSFRVGGFVIPSIPHGSNRRVHTTPNTWHARNNSRVVTPKGSPVLSNHSGCYSSSPIKNPVNVSFCQEDSSITPDSSFHRDLVLDEEPKTTIEPKNLMQAFINASSSDDED